MRKNHGSSAGGEHRLDVAEVRVQDRDEQREAEHEAEEEHHDERQQQQRRVEACRARASATGRSSTSIARKVTSCTVATDAGIVSRGKRTLRTSGAFSTRLGAAASSACEKNTHTIRPASRKIG